MKMARMFRALLISCIVRCNSEFTNGYTSNAYAAAQFGDILRPPPPPPSLSHILPVPFHKAPERHQRQNLNEGYSYQPPPSPPSNLDSTEINFPAPFYKQYNFNFVPSPQSFITTPSPSLYEKVTGWLFSEQSSTPTTNIVHSKKDCNPCNLVPWLPVIRYDLDAKNFKFRANPTYGPPSPTAHNFVNLQKPQSFQSQVPPNLAPGLPNGKYFSPTSFDSVVSTYGPPSPTHTTGITQKPQTSTYSVSSSSYSLPSSSYGLPSKSVKQINSQSSLQSSGYLPANTPITSYGVSGNPYNEITSDSNVESTNQPVVNSATPASTYGIPYSSTSSYEPRRPSNYVPNDVEIIRNIEPSHKHQLPKVSQPTGFKNSYGEPIENIFDLNLPYPVTATAAESTNIKTSVLPNHDSKYSIPNGSLALANPAPFSFNRGRNIHTLQPVALPNLSISPLPPIFNARPFRPVIPKFSTSFIQVVNQMQQTPNNVKLEQSVPIAEYTHSVEYPTTIIQSPVIDIDATKASNLTKSFRNIQNGYVVDDKTDIYPQASEDHISTTKTNQEASFESTGPEVGNDLYETNIGIGFKSSDASDNKLYFADLRRLKDEDVDKYRAESNLQNIDSPLLYLKPSAPHKEFEHFAITSPTKNHINHEYEIYDDYTTTTLPQVSNTRTIWDGFKPDYNDNFSLETPLAQEDANKPKIVQIVIPYTLNKDENIDFKLGSQEWINNPEDEYQARKVPTTSNTERYYDGEVFTENYNTVSTTERPETTTEQYETTRLNTAFILNDLYDVKEPPFDIIKLQHTIDDWTEQEFSNHYNKQNKYAKKIPDEYLTTMNPIYNYVTVAHNNYEYYDHEGSSSNHLTVKEEKNSTLSNHFRQHKKIDRSKSYNSKVNDDELNIKQNKPLIYTAATSFRKSTTKTTTTSTTTTSTPAPWGKIQTSISPLTKEKIYVVTSKPWRETYNITNHMNKANLFESKKLNISEIDNFSFKSPRFSNRPTFGVTTGGITASMETDSYNFSNMWHQRINNLEHGNNTSTWSDGSPLHVIGADIHEKTNTGTSAEKR